MTRPPRDNDAYRFPVSVKGVVIRNRAVVLLKNERDEWELPGGKLAPSESPEVCVAREIEEELQLTVEPDILLDSWIYTIVPGIHVLILTYGCSETSERHAILSHEHQELRWFPLAEVDSLTMPEGYKASIRRWAALLSLSIVLAALVLGGCALGPSRPAPASLHAGVDTGRIAIDGGSLFWEAAGNGAPVVLLHGGNLDRRMWDAQFEVLRRHYRVIRYDARGFGRSSPADARTAG
jgi:8-oxo-dGTP pyrophosphatase MutT (NUDIX family)